MQETFLKEFQSRGYFNQCTDHSGLNEIMNKSKIKAYIGFDCTAPSLHVGSLMQIMCLRLLQKYGHQPIVLLGGGTTLIGDPSGKEETRKILNKNEINKNIKSIENIFKIFLKSKNSKTKPIFVNNYSWLSKLNYINFLRDVGKYFTINKMLTFDSVKLRLEREQSLSYMEFNYMMLQAYDFYELNKKYKCILQIGGSDQWGNIVNGTDLIKRKDKKQTYGLTTPLLTMSSGAKMGKTEKGAIWLNKKMLSPYEYWQFWRNTDDKDVINFLKLFTDLSISKIDSLKDSQDINQLKILLANETTTMLHGLKAAKDSRELYALLKIKSEEDLIYQVASAYYQSLEIEAQIRSLDSNLLTLDKMSKVMLARYQNEMITANELDRITVQKTNLATQLQSLRAVRDQQVNYLKLLMGLPITAELSLEEPLDLEDLSLSLASYESQSPIELKILEKQKKLNLRNLEVTRAGYYPTLALFGQQSWQAQRNEFNFFDGNQPWFQQTVIGVQLQVPIFDGGTKHHKIQQNKLQMALILLSLETISLVHIRIFCPDLGNIFIGIWAFPVPGLFYMSSSKTVTQKLP